MEKAMVGSKVTYIRRMFSGSRYPAGGIHREFLIRYEVKENGKKWLYRKR